MRTRIVCLIALFSFFFSGAAHASEGLRRYLLAVGANSGGEDRVDLKYAVSDAERFTDIMVRMGGVESSDAIVLRDPDPGRLEDALAELAHKIQNAPGTRRTEVLVYYSGHADVDGLRVGTAHLPYSDLRDRIQNLAAAVRITVLDACASGSITRLKGGERRQPFLVDASSNMEGYAYLTSSSEDESAQESDAIGASFFTHYLVSGLRGAADVSGDGRVSLTEAYQFAFNETLARTTETVGGAQHPAYNMHLAGTGDVVLTDVRQTTAGLVLGEGLQGRFYIRDTDQHLVAELYKPEGRQVVLGLEAGSYVIHLDRDPELFVAQVELGLEELAVLQAKDFEVAERSPTVARGDQGEWPPRPGFLGPLVGRSRIRLTLGKSQAELGAAVESGGAVSASAKSQGLVFGLGYSRWVREDLSIGLDVLAMDGDAEVDVGPGTLTQATGIVSIRASVQKYLPASALRTPYRPFVVLGAGTFIGAEDTSGVESGGAVVATSNTMAAFGVELGAGVDFLLAHRFMLGAKASYNLLTDFPEELAGDRNYSGFELGVSIGWLFGRGFAG